MRLNEPTTWLEADAVIEIDEHPQLGQLLLRQWLDLHFYRAPGHPVNLILALKNEAHVKRSAVSTLMVGLGGRTHSTQAKLFGLSIYVHGVTTPSKRRYHQGHSPQTPLKKW